MSCQSKQVTFVANNLSSNVNRNKRLQLYYWHRFAGNFSHLLRVLSQTLKGAMMNKQVDIHVEVDIQVLAQVQVQGQVALRGWRHVSGRRVLPSTWGRLQLTRCHPCHFGPTGMQDQT
jgi:hypothetical protein